MLDWDDFRHFAALARERSLSAAATRLRVDHATVARRIAALEATLGIKLVDRRPRSYVLTADGERIAGLVERMEQESFSVLRAAQAMQSGTSGELSISAPPVIASALIAPRLGMLRERHPDLTIRLMSETRIVSLPRREADLAIRMTRSTDAELVIRKIGTLTFSLYASPAYLASRPPQDYVFIAFYDDSMGGSSTQQNWLEAKANGRPIVLRTNDLEAQRAAAKAGVGIAALPDFLSEGDPGIEPLHTEGTKIRRDVWLTMHQDIRQVASVRAVTDFLVECFPA